MKFTQRELLRIENMRRHNIPLTKIAQILDRNYMSVWQACNKEKMQFYRHNKIRKNMKEYEFQRDVEVRMGDYKLSCDRLAELFCERHDYYPLNGKPDFRSWWIGDRHGEVLAAGDFLFDMSTIVDDITLNLPEEWLIEWYDYRLEGGEMNYRSWAKLKQDKEHESKN